MMRKLSTNIGAIIVVTPKQYDKEFCQHIFQTLPLHRFAICGTVAEALEQIDHLIALETQ